MPVLGFERHAYMCPACGYTEQRTVFDKQAKERHDAEIAAVLTPPPLALSATIEDQQTAQDFLSRVLAKYAAKGRLDKRSIRH